MDLNEKETKTALEALYVAAKHHDNLAVGIWCKKLDELGVGFRAQNYIFSEASRDFSPGIPSGKINVAFDIAKEQYAIRRVTEMTSDGAGLDNTVNDPDTNPIKKGDIFVSHKGVEAKVVEMKSDSYYSGYMSQIRLQFLSGMNEGSKVWYDKKTLLNLFKIKEPVNQVDEIKVKQAVANLLSQYSKDEMLEGDWWVGSSVPIEGVSEYGIDVNVYVSDEEDPESPYSIIAYPLTPTEDGNYVADVSEVLFTHSLTKNELPLWIVSERFNAAPGTLQEAVTSLADKTSSQTLKQ